MTEHHVKIGARTISSIEKLNDPYSVMKVQNNFNSILFFFFLPCLWIMLSFILSFHDYVDSVISSETYN